LNFNVYIDEATGRQLARLSRQRKVARNALVREALQVLVRRHEEAGEWSAAVTTWTGDPAFEPFESHRSDLASRVVDDPLR
jgi:hypothetical protein